MKIKNLFCVALAGVIALVACKKDSDVTPSSDRTIKLNASVYGFTKATDTAFEEGDVMGVNVFKGEESYIHNAKFTNGASGLTSDKVYEWYEDEVEATITAYYPYSAELAEYTGTQTFAVKADQSTVAGYKSSDLLTAVTTSLPTEEAVELPFKHALSKVVINIDNQLDEEIANVWFVNVLGGVTFDPKNPAGLAASGEEGTIKAYKNGEAWQMIVAPQENSTPKLAITTVSEKQYTFTLTENVSFAAGKVNTATVTLSTESIYTSFTTEISDWVAADNELNFSQDDEQQEIPDIDPTEPGDGEGEGNNNNNNNGDDTKPQEVRIYLAKDWGWTYLWCWDENGTQIFEGATWPGTVKQGEENNYFYWVVPEAYVGKTVSLLFVKKTETEEEKSADYTNVTLSEDCYFHLEWTQETGVQVIPEEK